MLNKKKIEQIKTLKLKSQKKLRPEIFTSEANDESTGDGHYNSIKNTFRGAHKLSIFNKTSPVGFNNQKKFNFDKKDSFLGFKSRN